VIGTVTWLAVSQWKSHSVIFYLSRFFNVRNRGAEFHTFKCGIFDWFSVHCDGTQVYFHYCVIVSVFVADPVIHHQDRTVVHGDQPVILHCNASDPETVLWQIKYYWEPSVRDVYDGENVISSYKGRFTVDDVSHDLVIHRPVVSDTAEFWCIEKQGFGRRHITQLYVTGILLYFDIGWNIFFIVLKRINHVMSYEDSSTSTIYRHTTMLL